VARFVSGEPMIAEPDKFEKWIWVRWDDLPDPLFVPLLNLKESGFNPLDFMKQNNS
jgi:8-oxo-dGTP diphosphatase